MPTAEEAFDFFTRNWEPEEEEPAVEKAETEAKEKAEGEEGEEPKEGEEEEVSCLTSHTTLRKTFE